MKTCGVVGLITISERWPAKRFALLNLGFRPFFLLAGVYSVLAMGAWMGVWVLGWQTPVNGLSPYAWHAHEMIFGYAAAVIAGFLLTAVKNWTDQPMPQGGVLALIALLWWLPRMVFLFGGGLSLVFAAVADAAFMLAVIVAMVIPVVRTRQWKHMAIVAKLVLLLLANLLFYVGALGLHQQAQQWGVYFGFYMVISLILMMGRRVIPFFIEKGVDDAVTLINRKWLDLTSMVSFVAFMVMAVFTQQALVVAILAAALFMLHAMRLVGWYSAGIWRKPLLWILYVGYSAIVLGFALHVAAFLWGISPYLSIHAFAAGGIGMITLGMMARVALGHTGRNVFEPPRVLLPMFLMMLFAVLVRVIAPLMLPDSFYTLLVGVSQGLWIAAFLIFVVVYAPVLWRPRIDGQAG